MSFLVFDTETTGLPESFNLLVTPLTLNNWDYCRMVLLAWRIYSVDNKLLSSKCFLIKPEGFTIPLLSAMIHKITTEEALEKSHPLGDVLDFLFIDINVHEVVV